MLVFKNLVGTASQEVVADFDGRMAVHDEPTPGLLRQAQFGLTGVMLISGGAKAFIPLRELFNILERTDGTILLLSKAAPPPPSPGDTPALDPRHPRL
jgi:hypothetical protein